MGRFTYGVEGSVPEDGGCYSVHGSPPFGWIIAAGRGQCQGGGAASLHHHDLPHRPAGDARYASQQLDLASPATATVMPHALDDLPQQLVALREVRLGKDASFPQRSQVVLSSHDGKAANGWSAKGAASLVRRMPVAKC